MCIRDSTNLSHDIRTPLTSLDGYFQLMETCEDQEEQRRYMKIIQERIGLSLIHISQMLCYEAESCAVPVPVAVAHIHQPVTVLICLLYTSRCV